MIDSGASETVASQDKFRSYPMVETTGTVVHLKQPFNGTKITAMGITNRVQELSKTVRMSVLIFFVNE